MKITIINGSMPNYNHGLTSIISVIAETLSELGVTASEHNLALLQIPLYDGFETGTVSDIVNEIKTSDGVVFGASVSEFCYGAAFHTFFEYLSNPLYIDALQGKNCMVALMATDGCTFGAFNYYSGVLQHFGGLDSIRLAIGKIHMEGTEILPEAKEYIEKQVEDFYRISRQNRKFVLPKPNALDVSTLESLLSKPNKPTHNKAKTTVSDIYEKLKLDEFDEKQAEEINEIAKLFAEKFTEKEKEKELQTPQPKLEEILNVELEEQQAPVMPRKKTCHQLTSSLPHYFQPHLAGGVNEIIQLYITGEETITGFLTIQNTECSYSDGQADSPDITILADAGVWLNILKGKITAQKAFMVGQLKVRGNFVLLTKFEQIFAKQF